MPDQEAIQRGRGFEKYIAENLGGSVQPGSGNKFYAKNDVIANGLSLSAKSQKKFSWVEILTYLNESIDDSWGSGNIPVLALDDKECCEKIIVMRLSDFAKALQDEIKIPEHHDSKGIQKRSTAEVPLMLR